MIAFLLTSTFTWGVLQVGWDVTKAVGDHLGDRVEVIREIARWGVAWILAHGNLFVPVFFLGGIVCLLKKKPTE